MFIQANEKLKNDDSILSQFKLNILAVGDCRFRVMPFDLKLMILYLRRNSENVLALMVVEGYLNADSEGLKANTLKARFHLLEIDQDTRERDCAEDIDEVNRHRVLGSTQDARPFSDRH